MRNEPVYVWPRDDFTRIPFGVHHDREVCDSEQYRIDSTPGEEPPVMPEREVFRVDGLNEPISHYTAST